MKTNERNEMIITCKECGCTPKNDEWAVNSNEHCMDCEQDYNDYYNECQQEFNEMMTTFREENEISDEDQERANHIAKSMDRGEL